MKLKRKLGSTLGIIKLVNKYSGKSRWLLYLGFLTTLINSIAYIAGTVITGLIVSHVFTPEAFQNPTKFNHNYFNLMVSLMSLSFLTYAVFRFVEFRIYIICGYATAKNMRKIAMDKLLKMPVSYYDKKKTGDLISTLVNDVNNISVSLSQILNQVLSNITHLVITAIMMFLYSFTISLITGVITVILFSVAAVMIHKARPRIEAVWDGFGDLNAFVEESVKNMKITKTFGRQKESTEKFKKIANHIYKNALVADLYGQIANPWFIMSTNIVVLACAVLALVFKNYNLPLWALMPHPNGPDAGFIVAYVGLVFNITGALQTITNTIFASQNGIVSSERVNQLVNLEPPKELSNQVDLTNVKGHIKFDHVWFRYNTSKDEWHLKDASFQALPGQSIALVGATGAGKTTVINLLSKFYDYEKGSITIDGIELKNITKTSLTNAMAVVLQDSFMFKDSVYNNILIGNKDASQQQVYDASDIVSAHQTILRLEKGYDTQLQDNDMLLSKGEKQLLAIARAVLGDKKILILDEATSNIDSNTEKIIQDALSNTIMKNKTSIVIAHRLSTIKNADLILYVEDGYIVEQGTHEQLLAQQGKYASLYKSQFA
ncbi:ABC transporter ATP-binding protein [Mycoplasma zalophidermidis]|uniref:ABC transporter ATP-binding protein n=1 Tax=Mycoplasma zalophidermidis TaxID=398174 RepID=UPI001C127106|nr:ABC transporter ATP-binding protein [Mycoplasma zalophidermidis]MBU4690029.1 ABC transporter ATP-binding protein/permease [Mycoplasma zalophidermidis]MCR8966405.1 ABC transporter ATP-binding protein/permease [Mycoplasma zalophidermidis]